MSPNKGQAKAILKTVGISEMKRNPSREELVKWLIETYILQAEKPHPSFKTESANLGIVTLTAIKELIFSPIVFEYFWDNFVKSQRELITISFTEGWNNHGSDRTTCCSIYPRYGTIVSVTMENKIEAFYRAMYEFRRVRG